MIKLKYLLFLFIIFLCPLVYAESLSSVQIAYGYDRGTDTNIWSGYSSTLSHNFGTTDATIGYVNTFNVQAILNSGFQSGNYYTISYNWTNDYTGYSSSFSMFDAIYEMGFSSVRCSTTSSSSFLTPEQCFSSVSYRFEKTGNNSVRGIVSFVPLSNVVRILLNVTSNGTPSGTPMISNSFSFSNFSYSVSSGGTAEIIDNQNQNTQDIIDNQNQNNEELIDNINNNFNVCGNYDRTYSTSNNPYYSNVGYLDSNGNIVSIATNSRYTDFLVVNEGETYFIHRNSNNSLGLSYCLYDNEKTLISCSSYSTNLNISLSTSQNGYIRFSYELGDITHFSGHYCVNGFNNNNDEFILNGFSSINDSINNTFQTCENNTLSFRFSDYTSGCWLNSDGTTTCTINTSSYSISDFIPISSYSPYTVSTSNTLMKNASFCLYDINKQLISCTKFNNINNFNFNSGNASYFRTSIYSNTIVYLSGQICQSVFDKQNEKIDDLTNSINDSSIENGLGNSFFSNFTSQDFGLSQIITIPLSTIQSLTSKTCIPLQIPIPFTNSNVTLPCMTEVYETRLPTIYNLWKIVSFGIIAYLIAIDIFHIVKGFKDPESDKVEVLDL